MSHSRSSKTVLNLSTAAGTRASSAAAGSPMLSLPSRLAARKALAVATT